jgi:hypothetical protein
MATKKAAKKAAKKAPTKAAKKAAKKAPKHHDKKHGDKHESGKSLRKAYEHMGRLTALRGSLAAPVVAQIAVLTKVAETQLDSSEAKGAAHVLRAGEHLAFGSLAAATKGAPLSDHLESVVRDEYEHLMERAEDRWAEREDRREDEIAEVFASMTAAASAAFDKGAYRRALEYARGAEALAHVEAVDVKSLESGKEPKRKKLK